MSHHGLTPKEKGLPPAQYPPGSRTQITITAAWRARATSSRVLQPPKRQPARCNLRAFHTNTGCTLEATAGTSHHDLARKERGFPPMYSHVMVRRSITASATRRSCAASSRVLPSPERQLTQWPSRVGHAKATCVLEVIACISHHGLTPKDKGLPLVQCPSASRRQITTRAARRAHAASSRILPPPETQPTQWRLRTCHANAGCTLEATARTSHHGLARKERGFSPVQFPVAVRKPITVSATRRSPAASSRVLPPPETQPTQWRSRVGHAKADCMLEVTARMSHHGLTPKDKGLPLVQCPPDSRTQITTRAARRARAASSRISPPPETQPTQWRL